MKNAKRNGKKHMPPHSVVERFFYLAKATRGEIDLVRETATGFFIGWDLGGEGQPAPGEHRAQTLVATRTDQAIERHGGKMVEARAQLHTRRPCVASKALQATL